MQSGPRAVIEPIAIRDVLYYLAHSCALDDPVNRSFDIGRGQSQTFKSMMSDYAEVAGLATRHIWSLPIPAPRLQTAQQLDAEGGLTSQR